MVTRTTEKSAPRPMGKRWRALEARRATLASLFAQEGGGQLPEVGKYRWTSAMFDLVARRPVEVVEALEANAGMTLLAHALKGKGGTERSVAIVEVATHLAGPQTCELDAHTGSVRWMRTLTIEGKSVTEVDFFLAFDLLDREVRRA